MFGGGCPGGPPMNIMPMIPALPPKKRTPPPCQDDDDGSTKITAQLAAPFLEELTKLGECKELNAEVNGKVYNIRLCSKKSKKKKSSSSDDDSDDGGGSKECGGGSSKGPNIKLCDCNLPLPPGLCGNDNSTSDRKAIEREERMNKSLALCMKMMRELFIKNYDKQQEEDEDSVRMVEIPVMVVPPGGMPGMGMGMPGMGMSMPGMGMSMPGMGMGMPGMGMGGGGGPCCGSRKKDEDDDVQVICTTTRNQQCDESGMTPMKPAKPPGKKGKKPPGKKGKKPPGKKGKKK